MKCEDESSRQRNEPLKGTEVRENPGIQTLKGIHDCGIISDPLGTWGVALPGPLVVKWFHMASQGQW